MHDCSPVGDACDETWSLNEYGRLYNWYAVDDAGLCPGLARTHGRRWQVMEIALGMSKSEANNTSWRGTDQGSNESGLRVVQRGQWHEFERVSGLPGDGRNDNGRFQALESKDTGGLRRRSSTGTFSRSFDENVGRQRPEIWFFLRCIKNAE